MDMKIVLNKKNNTPKIKDVFMLDKNNIENTILPTFTKKIFKGVSKY